MNSYNNVRKTNHKQDIQARKNFSRKSKKVDKMLDAFYLADGLNEYYSHKN
jgi:hypothetical protein